MFYECLRYCPDPSNLQFLLCMPSVLHDNQGSVNFFGNYPKANGAKIYLPQLQSEPSKVCATTQFSLLRLSSGRSYSHKRTLLIWF